MAQALGHAADVNPKWPAFAYGNLSWYVKYKAEKQFTSYDFIAWCDASHYEQPPTPKAFGSIFTKAAKNGLIRKVGYRPHPLRHASPTVLWEVV